MSKYEDIFRREPPELRHPRMPRQDRAKLFAPFAALNGHGQAVHAREQVYYPMPSMGTERQRMLNETIKTLKKGDGVVVTRFVPKKEEKGELLGVYETILGTLFRVAPEEGMLYLLEQSIPLADLLDIRRKSG